MPSVSKRQHNLMELVKHDPGKARALGFKVPQKVAKEFTAADKGRVAGLPKRKR